MQEIWKDIKGYEGKYQISNYGKVKSLPKQMGRGMGYTTKEKVLKYSISSRGYCNVILCKNGKTKTFLLHRLVATYFVPNPNNYKQVNHKNECKTDNNWHNLEWCNQLYNNTYGTRIQRAKETWHKNHTKNGGKAYV